MEIQTQEQRHHHRRHHRVVDNGGANCNNLKKTRIPRRKMRRQRKNSSKNIECSSAADDIIKHGRPSRGYIGRPTCNAPAHVTEFQSINPESTSSNSEMEYNPEIFLQDQNSYQIEAANMAPRDRGPQLSSRELRDLITSYESAILNLNFMIRKEKKCNTQILEAVELEMKSRRLEEIIVEIESSKMEATSYENGND